jgi:hypothetical protein
MSIVDFDMSVRWKDEREQATKDVELLIKRISMHIQVDSSGAAMSYLGDPFCLLLSEFLKFHPDIPESKYKGYVQKAIGSAAKSGTLDAGRFLAEIRSHVAAFLKKPPKEYVLLTTVSLPPDFLLANKSFARSRRIDGCLIKFHPRMPKRFSRESAIVMAKSRGYVVDPTGYSFVSIRASGRSAEQAVNTALASFDLLRGVWNFSANCTTVRFKLGFTDSDPYNLVVRGAISTLHDINTGTEVDGFWVEESYLMPFRRPTRLQSEKENVMKGEAIFRRQLRHNPLRRIVEEWIREYVQALDTRDYNLAFLSLWRLLERMCGLGPREHHTEIVSRVCFLCDDPELARITLEMLRERRNAAVHNGRPLPDKHLAVSELRHYVEGVLAFMIRNRFKFETLEQFASFLKLKPDVQLLQSEVGLRNLGLRYIQERRKRRATSES